MKKISLFILVLSLVASAAFAQGGKALTTKGGDTSANAVMISGEVDIDWVFRDKALEEARWWGTNANALKASNFFNMYVMVRMDVAVSDGVDAVLTFENNRYVNGTAAVDSQSTVYRDALSLEIGLANIKVKELFTKELSATVGIQDYKLDWRGRGEPFFLDVRNAESPWSQVNDTVPQPNIGPNTVLNDAGYPLRHPVGFTFEYDYSPVNFKLMLADVGHSTKNAGAFGTSGTFNRGNQEDIIVANFSYDLGKDKVFNLGPGSNINFLISYFIGGTGTNNALGIPIGGNDTTDPSSQELFTFGLGFDLRDLLTPGLEFWAEGYLQTGDAGETATGTKIDAEGTAFQVGLRYEFQNVSYKPWVEVSYWFVSGDEHMDSIGGDTDYEGFISYENVNDFAIVEGKLWGLDIDTGYTAFKFAAGGSVDIGNGRSVDITSKFGIFEFEEEQPLDSTPFSDDQLGTELDIKATLNYSKNVSFYVQYATLFDADALQFFTSNADDDSQLVLLGSQIMF